MAFFNSSSPAYKKAASLNAAAYTPSGSNGLASMFASLLGGTTPVYKTVGGHAGRAPDSSSGLLRIFIGTPPSYKTAQPMNTELADDDSGDADETEYADDACPSPTDTVVLL